MSGNRLSTDLSKTDCGDAWHCLLRQGQVSFLTLIHTFVQLDTTDTYFQPELVPVQIKKGDVVAIKEEKIDNGEIVGDAGKK